MGLKERIPHCSTPNLSHFQLVPGRSLSICCFEVNYSSYPGQVLSSSTIISFVPAKNKVSLQNRGKDIKSKFFLQGRGKKCFSSQSAQKSRVPPDAISQKPGLWQCLWMKWDDTYYMGKAIEDWKKSIASRQVRLPYLKKVTTRNGWWSFFGTEFRAISVGFFSFSSPPPLLSKMRKNS